MRVTKTIKADDIRARKYYRKYGDKLLSVRHVEDEEKQCLHTTVEIIVETHALEASLRDNSDSSHDRKIWVAVDIPWSEEALRMRAKSLGARWSSHYRVWVMLYEHAAELGVINRVVPDLIYKIEDVSFDD